MNMTGQHHAPATSPPKKDPRNQLYRKLGGTQSGPDVLENIKRTLAIQIAQPVAQYLY
jgi:hypothetical protein